MAYKNLHNRIQYATMNGSRGMNRTATRDYGRGGKMLEVKVGTGAWTNWDSACNRLHNPKEYAKFYTAEKQIKYERSITNMLEKLAVHTNQYSDVKDPIHAELEAEKQLVLNEKATKNNERFRKTRTGEIKEGVNLDKELRAKMRRHTLPVNRTSEMGTIVRDKQVAMDTTKGFATPEFETWSIRRTPV